MKQKLAVLSILTLCLWSINTFSAESCPATGNQWKVPGLGMEFVYVAPGSFMMGSNDGDYDEKPVHQVTFSNGYWIGKYEVTQNEYQSITGNNPGKFKGRNNPVESVSWNDAMRFCRKLTEQERAAGRLPSGYEYRLPTEAQWEFAARGGTVGKGYKFSGGDNPASLAWYRDNSNISTHEVGTMAANELGIYDMSGNVWEWCLDDWHKDYKGAPADGSRWGDGSGEYRVNRGGGWSTGIKSCRSALRFACKPSYTDFFLGFRVALVPE